MSEKKYCFSVSLWASLALVTIQILFLANSARAEQSYVWPIPDANKASRYPITAQFDSAEGLVTYTYVVDETGKVQDIAITQLLGEEVFESRVVSWLEEKTFSPALLNGEPVPSWEQQRHVFLLDGKTRGAKNSFVVHWKRFFRSLQQSDFSGAAKYIRRMEKVSDRSLYEELYLQHATATLAIAQSEYSKAYPHLQNIQSLMIYEFGEEGGLVGPADLYYGLLLEKYQIEAERLLLGDAMETRNALQELYPAAENTLIVEEHLASLLERVSGKEFRVEVTLVPSIYSGDEGGWATRLVSRSFTLSDIAGVLTTAILDCDGGQLFLEVSDGDPLDVPHDWGACRLVLLGDVGTKMNLSQRRR